MPDVPACMDDERIDCVLVSEEEIRQRVAELARDISRDHADCERLYVLGVLNGAFVFAADLARELRRAGAPSAQYGFIRASAYGTTVRGPDGDGPELSVRVEYMPGDLHGRHILLVDDIFDRGTTLAKLREMLRREVKPRSLKLCVLLRKLLGDAAASASREAAVPAPDYVGFDVPDRWVAGYGLDAAEEFRDYPCVVVVKEEYFR